MSLTPEQRKQLTTAAPICSADGEPTPAYAVYSNLQSSIAALDSTKPRRRRGQWRRADPDGSAPAAGLGRLALADGGSRAAVEEALATTPSWKGWSR